MTILSNKMIKKYALPAIAALKLCIVLYLILQSSPQKDSGSPVQEQFSGPGEILKNILKQIRGLFPTKQASPEEPPQESQEDSLKVEPTL